VRNEQIIRVFARRTSMTPTDCWAFYDEPPLFDLPNWPVYVSVTFTWDIEKGERLAAAWQGKAGEVFIGGPAFGGKSNQFTPGLFLKDGITITSRGCPKRCPWCMVPVREGRLRPISIKPGHIVQDNNILACSTRHFERVCEMLSKQPKGAVFKGGLDIDFLTEWHVEQLKGIRVNELWVACDTDAALARLDKAADLLGDFSIEKKRCYVLIGFGGPAEPVYLEAAERRLEAVYAKGFLPFAQLYRSAIGDEKYPKEWKALARKWSRPAL